MYPKELVVGDQAPLQPALNRGQTQRSCTVQEMMESRMSLKLKGQRLKHGVCPCNALDLLEREGEKGRAADQRDYGSIIIAIKNYS
jgi:hypothetical protein